MVVALCGVRVEAVERYHIEFRTQRTLDEPGHNGQLPAQVVGVCGCICTGIVSHRNCFRIAERIVGDCPDIAQLFAIIAIGYVVHVVKAAGLGNFVQQIRVAHRQAHAVHVFVV